MYAYTMAVANNVYDLFNTKLQNFMDDLNLVLGDEFTEFAWLRGACKIFSSINPKQNAQFFLEHVNKPYEDNIRRKDEAFFLDHQYDAVTKDAQDNLNLVNLLKNIWSELSPENKEAIWAHLNVLVTLANKCAECG